MKFFFFLQTLNLHPNKPKYKSKQKKHFIPRNKKTIKVKNKNFKILKI